MEIIAILLAITFHPVTVADLPTSVHTHVKVCGLVTLAKPEDDGDFHIRIADGARFVVAEIIPAIRLAHPSVGQRICVNGISREDKAHRWYEIHPVLSWVVQGHDGPDRGGL